MTTKSSTSGSMYRSESEVRERFGTIPPTQLGVPVFNPKTRKPYHKNTWHWWRWYYGLTERDKRVFGDLEF